MSTASDAEILALAVQEDRIVVTADTDFGTILAMTGQAWPSVIQFRGDCPDDPQDQLDWLLRHLATIENDLNAGALVTLSPSRIRIRLLPI
jgi:predicted nuclease of predicted toxin-antitoxin system